jgi:hypothetical protein
MGGPWEQYQSAEGPWSAYQKPKEQSRPDPSAGGGMLRPFGIDTGIQTPQWLDRGLAGTGKAFADLGRGAGQWIGLVDRADVAESRRLDAPLMDTAAGKVGNIGGNVAMLAPSALIPGANTYTGAATIGAITGALQPSESTGETLTNIGLGGAGGAAGQKLANVAGKYIANQGTQAAAAQTANAQKVAAAKEAMDAGYVIPPADLPNASRLTEAVSGLSGKIKTAQQASAKNQGVTNTLVRKELGLADDAPLNIDTLKAIRSQAGQAYDAVSSVGTITPSKAYSDALDKIIAPYKQAAQGFPNAKPNPVIAEIDSLRSDAFDAASAVAKIRELREAADAAYVAGNKGAGKALKDASQALEASIDEHLTKVGAPADLLQGFRDARQTIAKTYTVQKALNPETGDVSARVLAGELKRDKPLSGGLKTVAKVGQSFEKATQSLKETPKALSPLDFGAAGLGLVGSGGNPLAAAGLVARPAARAALLSGPVQRNALANAGALQSPNMLARLLQREPVALPLGVLGGTGLANYLAQQ